MPEQYDYNADDTTLVPGSLTVFRHFKVDVASALLYPMSASPGHPAYKRYVDYPTLAPMNTRRATAEPYEPMATTHRAACAGGVETQPGPHEAPSTRCKCGFYASYDQETDFYAGSYWGAEYSNNISAPWLENVVIVRAAVEMTGRVVMGRLGVRAEKMQIKAIAVDFSKHKWYVPVETDDPMYLTVDCPCGQPSCMYGQVKTAWTSNPNEYRFWTGAMDRARYGLGAPDEDRVRSQVAGVADRYRVKFYSTPGFMHTDFPQEDIAALGVDTTPRSRAEDTYISVYARIQSAAQSFSDVSKMLQTAFDQVLYPKDKVSPAKKPKAAPPSGPWQRAIEAKANRPAPPGSGIDRRRGERR